MKRDFDSLVENIQKKISDYISDGRKVFASSSFQTSSMVLLHILSRRDDKVPVYFLNTGYHFPETIAYKNRVVSLMGLDVIDVFPYVSKCHQVNAKGQLLYSSDPDECCFYNKVEPLENILAQHDIWISGVRKQQTYERKQMQEEEEGKKGVVLYRPLLEWTDEMVKTYIKKYDLPEHPLAPVSSNISIGCEPCTHLVSGDSSLFSRVGRWTGLKKKECGIHTRFGGKR